MSVAPHHQPEYYSALPAASKLLGFKLLRLDPQTHEVDAEFVAHEDFLNPGGTVQGGFVTAMLDDVMSMAGVISQPDPGWVPTLQMSVSFLRPMRAGPVLAYGRVKRAGRTTVHTYGWVTDRTGSRLAEATAACVPRPIPQS